MNILTSLRTAPDRSASPRSAATQPAATQSPPAAPAPKPLAEHLAMGFGVGLPFLGLVAAVVLLWGQGVGWLDMGLLVGGYVVTALGVTVGFHRLFTHRAAEVKPVVRLALRHRRVDVQPGAGAPVVRDPPPPPPAQRPRGRPPLPAPARRGRRARCCAACGTPTSAGCSSPSRRAWPAPCPTSLADPVLCFVDKYCWLWVFLGWALPGAFAGLVTRSWVGALGGFLWGGLVRTFLLHHVTWSINSVCHVWGTRPFDGPDHSRNNAVFGVLAFGEGWHNNHHAFPTSARHGLRWWQIDMSYWLILLLRALHLASDVRVPSDSAIRARQRPQPVRPVAAAEKADVGAGAAEATREAGALTAAPSVP